MSSQPDIATVVQRVCEDVTSRIGEGRVADYIPALANVPIDRFGIAVRTACGASAHAGDAEEPFSIQSISKVFTLTLALEARGEALWQRVGKEPSGEPFNSLLQLEHECGVPRNPLINAGALVVADCLVSDHARPLETLLFKVRSLAGERISYDTHVANSELATADRNASMAHLMKSFGTLENSVEAVLNAYCHQCALSMNYCELAEALGYLADCGSHSSLTDHESLSEAGTASSAIQVVDAARARRINALMLTCGTYDRAGEFAYEVGLAAKSGVGGGIVAVVPGRGTVAVWSPGLGKSGNSVVGVEALKRFVALTGWSVF